MGGIFRMAMQGMRMMFCGRANSTVGGAAIVIAVFGMLSRVLGFVRDRILAGTFGAGDTLDAYYAAFRIPDFLYGLLVAGALSAAFVPIFAELRERKGDKSAWELANGVLLFVIAALGGVSLVAMIFSSQLLPFLVPGFSNEKQEATVQLTRIMLAGPIFLGVSAVFGSILVSFRNFIVFSLAPVFYNAGIIFGVTVLSKFFGESGLAMGVVFGTVLHACVQYPSVRQAGFRFSIHSSLLRNREVFRVVRLMIPRSISIAVGQVGFLAATFFASVLASGTLAAYTLANNIQSVPLGLFGVAFSLAAFPTLSAFAARDERQRFSLTLAKTAKQMLFFVLPIGFMIIALRAQIVRIILGTGEFDWNDTRMTFEILGVLSASLFAQSLIPLFARAFFSLQDTKTPLFIALASEVLHIVFLIIGIRTWGVAALPLSFSIASVFNFALLYIFLRKRLDAWDDRAFFSSISKMVVASVASVGAVQLGKLFFEVGNVRLDTFVEVLLEFLWSSLLGAGAFVLAAWALRIEELESVWRFIVSKFSRSPEILKESEEESLHGTAV